MSEIPWLEILLAWNLHDRDTMVRNLVGLEPPCQRYHGKKSCWPGTSMSEIPWLEILLAWNLHVRDTTVRNLVGLEPPKRFLP
ncbi:hypothetical protein DPMN_162714 [Dreissena polymorpha]|uniref:Uncharacterized protein n=1 Tax=Dreissena polymorpha TaxID=45954 RepID=A0A9D4IU05_DREPO|nr:hypothetical protein DPMN_162714 [Dreissena polymorpha]